MNGRIIEISPVWLYISALIISVIIVTRKYYLHKEVDFSTPLFVFVTLPVVHALFFPLEIQTPLQWHMPTPNLIPFAKFHSSALYFAGNILGFVPLGFCAVFRFGSRGAFFPLIFSLSCEATQFLLDMFLGCHRMFDINDIILNTFGGVLGYAFYSIVRNFLKLDNKGFLHNIKKSEKNY